MKDEDKRLGDFGIKDGTKIMLIGSTLTEVMQAATNTVTPEETKAEEESSREWLSTKLPHKKIIDKGVPEGAEPGKRGRHEALPTIPLQNIYNNTGIKVRLTFKVWSQELWVQSASSTQKIPFGTIRSVASEPIQGHEEYHIMSLQIGSSEGSKYFLYWVPCQYVNAIRNAIVNGPY
eukprot:TRINITY_DN1495_c0_g1_i1.p1 TRINITY_DN1495_c0_g1~~TRINITY_DN1495_c0_g1_i1.p1  ORF type:complete len:177 (+),score=41.52 TRINITY_DN1495_c0_g1_i1:269-799(+)